MTTADDNPSLLAVKGLQDVDRLVHEPARLGIMTVLSSAEVVEFKFVSTVLGLSKGNLSSHTQKLEDAGYIKIIKGYDGKKPMTSFRITSRGQKALSAYWEGMRAAIPGTEL
jgi:DNA-binding transcriptional ArsR family regulator